MTSIPPRPPLPPPVPARPPVARRVGAGIVLAGYALALAAVAFWPTPVDAGLGRLIRAITRRLPVLTYERLEFLANVAMFIPLGVLLALVLIRSRSLVMPIVFLTTFTIECVQALLLPERTPSIMDMVANTAGGCIGLITVAALEPLYRRR